MFAPTKTWRRWHRRVNLNQRRYAVASAVAASAVPSLVLARGHRIDRVPEIPLVVDNKLIDAVDKTKKAVKLLKQVAALRDVEKVKYSPDCALVRVRCETAVTFNVVVPSSSTRRPLL